MEFILDRKLKEYIKEKGAKKIIINNVSTKMCCGRIALPTAQLGEPDEKKNYYKYNLDDGLEVYLQKGIEAKDDKIFLNLRNFGLFKDIEVNNIKLLG